MHLPPLALIRRQSKSTIPFIYLGRFPSTRRPWNWLTGDISVHIRRVFDNLSAVCAASGGDLSDIVKLNIFLTDLDNFAAVNQTMGEYFQQPYPARAAIGVSQLPKGAMVEMDGIMVI